MQATGLLLLLTAGFGKPKDLADVAIETVMSMEHQPGLSHQQAVLAGIASVRLVYNQQVRDLRSASIATCLLVALSRDCLSFLQCSIRSWSWLACCMLWVV